jgi:hypothetical protein
MTSILSGVVASGKTGHLSVPIQGSYDALATVTVPSGGTSTITFSGLPTTYKHLQLRGDVITGTLGWVTLRFNGDSGSNYSFHELRGDGSTASANQVAPASAYQSFLHNTTVGSGIIDILDYTNINKNKTARTLGGYDANGSGYISMTSGVWINTNAINSITITSSTSTFSQYSTFSLYGVR